MSLLNYTSNLAHKEGTIDMGQQMLIASFTVGMSQIRMQSSTTEAINIIDGLLENDAIKYAINNSYGGLYVDTELGKEAMSLESYRRCLLYVSVDPAVYTYCQLKYRDWFNTCNQ